MKLTHTGHRRNKEMTNDKGDAVACYSSPSYDRHTATSLNVINKVSLPN